jgi:response regulator RpfG family c-di-GMP phosphodiesterase
MDSPRVLVVEDFKDLRNLVAFFLDARGYQVLEAGNGTAAIQTALSRNPNFILFRGLGYAFEKIPLTSSKTFSAPPSA